MKLLRLQKTKRFAQTVAIMALAAAILVSLAACGKKGDTSSADGKVSVVTTFYPLYYLAEQIGGDDAHVVNLIPSGVEPHDWSPKSRDLQTVEDAQLFLYNGAGLEGWVDDFLKGLGSSNKTMTVKASEGIDLIQGNPENEEVVEGSEGEQEEQGHDDDHGHDDHAHDVDPHTWVSPKSARTMAKTIFDAYIKADSAHQEDYEQRYKELDSKLAALDQRFTDELSALPRKDIVVSHQAFGYLCRDYGLKQIPIMGLSPDAEPRAQDLLRIADFVKKNGIRYIFFEELVTDRLAKTLANEADVETLVLNPLEGLTPEQEKDGDDYMTIMEQNLQNLKLALQ